MSITDALRLDSRTIFVVGAGGAIGSTVSAVLAEAGARTILVDIDAARLAEVSERVGHAGRGGPPPAAYRCDASNVDAFAEMAARAAEQHGPPDGLMCLVGGVEPSEFGPFRGTATRTYDDMVDRNLRSAVVAHEIIGGLMIDAGRSGSLVSVSAATALASAPFHALYAAAKAGLMSLVRTLAVEWGALGIRVNSVAPGAVETRPPADPDEVARWERAAIPLARRVRPVEIAATALFLLSDLSSAITGQTIVLDGGALAKPSFLDADNVPVFVTDKALRERMRGSKPTTI